MTARGASRWLWLVLLCGCGPVVGTPEGSSDSTAAQTDAADTTPGVTSVDVTTSTTSPGTTSTTATTTTTSGSDGMNPIFDLGLPPDTPVESCPVSPRPNADVTGQSAVGSFDLPWAWFAIGGGGECGYILTVVFTPDVETFVAGHQAFWPEGITVFDEALDVTAIPVPGFDQTEAVDATYYRAGAGEPTFGSGIVEITAMGPGFLDGVVTLDEGETVGGGTFQAVECPALAFPPCP